METKSNSIEVALSVLEIPKAVSRSGSVPQLGLPSLRVFVFNVFPPEFALPVEITIPFSKGKLELPLVKLA